MTFDSGSGVWYAPIEMRNRPGHLLIDDLLEEMSKREPRDEHGLTRDQRRFLKARLFTISDREALDEANCKMVDLIHWRDEPDFEGAYQALLPRTITEQVKGGLDALAPGILSLVRQALDGEELTKTQRWIVDKYLKVLGLEKVLVETMHTVIPYEARLGLALLERGMAISPALRDLVLEYFPDRYKALPEPSVIEGEVVEVPVKEASTEDTGGSRSSGSKKRLPKSP